MVESEKSVGKGRRGQVLNIKSRRCKGHGAKCRKSRQREDDGSCQKFEAPNVEAAVRLKRCKS